MKLERVVSGEALEADLALKGLDARVQLDVLLQVVVACECRAANLAFVRLGLVRLECPSSHGRVPAAGRLIELKVK